MAHASLKDQLQALNVGFSSNATDTQSTENDNKKKKAKQKISWIEYAQYGVELLKAYYPNCFKDPADVQPLKIGIKQDLVKQLGARDDIVMSDKACMVSSLAFYVNSPAYHRSVVKDAVRIDLEGKPCGNVTEEEARYSQEYRKTKVQKNKVRQSHQKNIPSQI